MKILKIVGLFCLLALSFEVSIPARAGGDGSRADDQPEVVSAVAPFYPTIATTIRAHGNVVMEVTIDNQGAVKTAIPVSGHPLLLEACVKTAKRWRFVEAKDSKALRVARLTFIFSFRGDGPEPPDAERNLIIFAPPYQVELSMYNVIRQTSH